ncbi:receptor-type tyrosine-protein phosphatase U-like, partial [Saccoglossus kowalevskii]
ITYRSYDSVYSTTVFESKNLHIQGSIDTHTLEELPPGTQFEISVSASTAKGFGKPKSIISGTKIGIDVSDILEQPHMTTETKLTETTASIGLRKPKLNTDIKTDTQLMSYIVVVEEERQTRKRDLKDNQYITASLSLNSIPSELTVGDGMEYNGYINKPLTPGQQYIIYDGLAVNTTGKEELMLHDSQLTSFTAGEKKNRITEGANIIPTFIGGFAGGVVVTIVIGVLLLCLICRLKSHNKHKERNESHDDFTHAEEESIEVKDYGNIHTKENDHYQDLRDVQENNYEELKMNEYR